MQKNRLYYGDNLDVLRRYVPDASVDLVYLDPPFNSNANYNVLCAEKSGTRAAAQIKAFEDTWQWDESAAEAYRDVVYVEELIGPDTVNTVPEQTYLAFKDHGRVRGPTPGAVPCLCVSPAVPLISQPRSAACRF